VLVLSAGLGLVVAALAATRWREDDRNLTIAPTSLAIEDLKPALLTAGEIGEGYRREPEFADVDSMSMDRFQVSDTCREALHVTGVGRPDERRLHVNFTNSDESTTLMHQISLVDEDDPQFSELSRALGECGTMRFESGDLQGQVRMTASALDGVGEAALEISIEVETHHGSLRVTTKGYAIAWAHAGVLSVVSVGSTPNGREPKQAPAERDLVWNSVETADRHLQRVLRLPPT
jgi:hypothetical protein